jgi:hypothetical protein
MPVELRLTARTKYLLLASSKLLCGAVRLTGPRTKSGGTRLDEIAEMLKGMQFSLPSKAQHRDV